MNSPLEKTEWTSDAALKQAPPPVRRRGWGMAAFVCAALALVGAILGPQIAERFAPPAPVEEKVADAVVRMRDAVVAKLKDKNAKVAAAERSASLHARIMTWSLALGALGLITAGVSYVRRENHRLAVTAGGLALVGLAWHAVMIAIGAIIVIVIVAVILGALDLS